jgi:hypothetical protein
VGSHFVPGDLTSSIQASPPKVPTSNQ